MVPKKGLEPSNLGSAFPFNEIPLSIEYTTLSDFSILSIPSTKAIEWCLFSSGVDTMTL